MQSDMFHYIPNFMNKEEQSELLTYLEASHFIPAPQFTPNSVSREQKWFNKKKEYFCPTWKKRFPQWESFDVDSTIMLLMNKMQELVNNKTDINSCLINKYLTGKHFIAPHRDSLDSFGPEPTIIILSLGATRTLLFENDMEKFSFDLESGSVFIMSGKSQETYLHSIQKSDCTDVRYSLTFREFIL
jgi:alkylated DNA repair dioxygenase AlkB